ncbi:MAG TPA: IPT/TIG domain-containing protein [Candidatus Saccharimonadales bacterium]|nr:IPT/TIG domain-containing protein [Candidatus Saccharimonadales bacterium]
MKGSWTALAVIVLALGVLGGCSDYNNTVQYATGATITSLSPSSIVAGMPAPGTAANCPNTTGGQNNPCFTLIVTGSIVNGFLSTTVVQWNQTTLPACSATAGSNGCSTYVNAVTMQAQVPYSLVTKVQDVFVNTYTPQSGSGKNGLSNSLRFRIVGEPNPFPTITSISPTSGTVCTATTCPDVPITVSGSNFIPASNNGGSKVTFTGAGTQGVETAITVTSYSSTELKATIPGAYLQITDSSKLPDLARINVNNPSADPGCITTGCGNLGGGDTNCTTPPIPSTCVVSTQIFTISASGAAASTAQMVAEEAAAVSQDGRYVAYASVQGGNSQILLRDTCLGAANDCVAATRTVSVSSDGTSGNGDSHNAAMTLDGRYVAFSSAATNLVSNAATGRQVYLRDTCIGAAADCKPSTTLISKDEEGKLTGTEGILPSISSSGRFVAFLALTPSAKNSESTTHAQSASPNSGLRQVFVRDTCLGATDCTPKTTRISLEPGDTPANSTKPAGPSIAGLAKQIAVSDAKSSTVFTPTTPVDDRVFLAIPKENQ